MSHLESILTQNIGTGRTERLLRILETPSGLGAEQSHEVTRATIAQALNMLLFEDLLERVPAAKTYATDCRLAGRKIMHDHGAVRTVLLDGMGSLPAGQEAITRILRPLGYALNGVYPLERLKMTGRSHAQVEHPEEIAQFFISEIHPDRFSQEFQQSVRNVTGNSIDPLTPDAVALLDKLNRARSLPPGEAVRLLPLLTRCFVRQHQVPTLQDYEILLAESPEMAWISTEGNAFNHATSRVPDVDALSYELKLLGLPMKPTVETSQSGRVRQTAFLAARVKRWFLTAKFNSNGVPEQVEREVPGSFYEFITRLPLPEERDGKPVLDLSFDSSNAQGIFKMTAEAK